MHTYVHVLLLWLCHYDHDDYILPPLRQMNGMMLIIALIVKVNTIL